MKKLVRIAVICLLVAVASAGWAQAPQIRQPAAGTKAASAAEGCGPGFYRGRYGNCRPMAGRGPVVVVAPAPVVVVRPRVCPYGFRWYAGRCRPF